MNVTGAFVRRVELAHQDDRRDLFSIFNGDIPDFTAAQLKWFEFKRDAKVGGHFHQFAELFCIVQGGGTYRLVNVDQVKEDQTYALVKGDILFVPPRVAHTAWVTRGSLVIAANSQPYDCAQTCDFTFDFDRRVIVQDKA